MKPYWRSVARVAWRAVGRFQSHAGADRAAGVAFYALLSLLPLLILLVSFASFVLGSYEDAYSATLYLFRGVVVHLDARSLEAIQRFAGRSRQFQLPGILILIWTSRRIFVSLFSALEAVFEAPARGIAHVNLVALAMVPAMGIGLLMTLAVSTGVATAEGLLTHFTGPRAAQAVHGLTAAFLAHALPAVITFTFFFVIYRVAPRRVVKTRDAMLGATLATILWETAKAAFAYYIRHLADYAGVYGALEAFIVLALWLEISMVIVLYCGEVVAVLIGPDRPSPAD